MWYVTVVGFYSLSMYAIGTSQHCCCLYELANANARPNIAHCGIWKVNLRGTCDLDPLTFHPQLMSILTSMQDLCATDHAMVYSCAAL